MDVALATTEFMGKNETPLIWIRQKNEPRTVAIERNTCGDKLNFYMECKMESSPTRSKGQDSLGWGQITLLGGQYLQPRLAMVLNEAFLSILDTRCISIWILIFAYNFTIYIISKIFDIDVEKLRYNNLRKVFSSFCAISNVDLLSIWISWKNCNFSSFFAEWWFRIRHGTCHEPIHWKFCFAFTDKPF